MTPQTKWHKHRHFKVQPNGLVCRVLRRPLLHTENLPWVDRSRLVFGPCHKHRVAKGEPRPCWTLSLLGILHQLTGLTLYWPPPVTSPDWTDGT